MASNLRAMSSNHLRPKSDGLQPKSDGLQPKSNGQNGPCFGCDFAVFLGDFWFCQASALRVPEYVQSKGPAACQPTSTSTA